MKKVIITMLIIAAVVSVIIVYSTSNPLVEIRSSDIEKIELHSIEGVKIKEFTAEEFEVIVKAYNTARIDDGMHIEMLAGSMMTIVFKDASSLSVTSYGSKTHIVTGGKIMGKDANYHLECPVIAEILLAGY
ncbi:MAG: hypothetical protein ACOZCL_11060 [Bacillota bacterium]